MSGKSNKQYADEMLKKAYEGYYVSIYRYCLSRLRSNELAEDCTHDAFLVLYKKYLQGEEVEYVKQFLLKTSNNFVLKRFEELKKAQNIANIDELIYIPSQNEDIDERLAFEEYSRQISAALSTLDAKIFNMKYNEGYKISEIAEELDMTICSVTKRLSRMRSKLREIFSNNN